MRFRQYKQAGRRHQKWHPAEATLRNRFSVLGPGSVFHVEAGRACVP